MNADKNWGIVFWGLAWIMLVVSETSRTGDRQIEIQDENSQISREIARQGAFNLLKLQLLAQKNLTVSLESLNVQEINYRVL